MSSAAVHASSPPHYDTISKHDTYAVPSTVAAAASLPSNSPASRRPVGNAAPPPPPYQSDNKTSLPMSSPRGQPTLLASSIADGTANSTYDPFYPEKPSASGPIASLPIRTSSQQQMPATSTTAFYESPRYKTQTTSGGYGSESEMAPTSASESERRRQQKSPRDQNGSGARSQRTRQAPTASRSQTAVGQTPVDTSLPRENSAIINHIVVDDPGADIARERARLAEARPMPIDSEAPAPSVPLASMSTLDASPAAVTPQRSRQEHLKQQSAHRKEVKFGDYILGTTLGEGEFGKVKMGWKKDSTVQVAIKLIRKEALSGNATRLPKIYREISILRGLQHPNIVRLHEFIETERHMGIVLEYASGGELFDYILKHRYLKDPQARRLFAQLVSGVGYLHKKGIVHRDLKLENLLLDRNKNIIITDFGFANTFNPHDELGEEIERHIGDKNFVKQHGLDIVGPDNHRRGDLMQTSCGSPCYAAPELVVSDGLYTGRKVDVWSCGVILYAMLAGYLPFDDDPSNPEGDNINLLYKYIVTTALTFPEYVTPHARDLLKRILVPDPRLRADLFEVARHSWLSEFSHVVGFIGSSVKSDEDIARSAAQQNLDEPALGRSASVREPTTKSPAAANVGIAARQPANSADEGNSRNSQRDAKRRTVQVEYVPPNATTTRGDGTASVPQTTPVASGSSRTRARSDSQGPVEVTPTPAREVQFPRKEVPTTAAMPPPPSRAVRDQVRTTADYTPISGQPTTSVSRPTTGGTLGGRLPSRGNSYSQPSVATPTTTIAQGHFSQPKASAGYVIPIPPSDQNSGQDAYGRPMSQQSLAQYQQQYSSSSVQQYQQQQSQQPMPDRGHKRSSTLSSIGDRIMGRSNSRRLSKQAPPDQQANEKDSKRDRRYPPVSLKKAFPNNGPIDDVTPRPSSESKRRPSFTFLRKNSDQSAQVSNAGEGRRNSRRFSFLPSSFSMNNFGGGSGRRDGSTDRAGGYDSEATNTGRNGRRDSMQRLAGGAAGRPQSKGQGMAFGRGMSRSPSRDTTNSAAPLYYDEQREADRRQRRSDMYGAAGQQGQQYGTPGGRYDKALPPKPGQGLAGADDGMPPRKQFRDDGYGGNLLSDNSSQAPRGGNVGADEPVERYYTPVESATEHARLQQPQSQPQQYSSASYPADNDGYGANQTTPLAGEGTNVSNIRPQQRKFADAYEGSAGGYAGSSSRARRVTDFFRWRGKERVG